MLNKLGFAGVATAVLLLHGGSVTARGFDDKAYTIAAKYAVGEVVKYKMTSNLKMEMTAEGSQAALPGGDFLMSMVIAYKTTKVDEKGGATLVATTKNLKGTVFGQAAPPRTIPPITLEVDNRGISRGVEGLQKAPGAEALQQLFDFKSMPSSGLYYPDHPVKVGDTWEGEMAYVMGAKKAKVSAQLVSVDRVDGKDDYRIKQTWTIPVELMIGSSGPTKNADEAMTVISGEVVSVGDVHVSSENGRVSRLLNDVDGKLEIELKGQLAQQAPFKKMNMKLTGKAGLAPATAADEVEAPPAAVKKPGAATPVKTPSKKSGSSKAKSGANNGGKSG